jgi:cellulose synthase/poly-beta-1,6-N-acetylglucosamine synthase-like glycosyltransferase
LSTAYSETVAPTNLGGLWRQRLRWITGWLHNLLGIHADLLIKRSRLSALLWYSIVFEYVGMFVDLVGLVAFPLLFWFAPDPSHFALNLVVFALYGLLIGLINQAVALKYAYGRYSYGKLLFYVPLYPFFWVFNLLTRLRSILIYASGSNGKWH